MINEDWVIELQRLEDYFKTVQKPAGGFDLDKHIHVVNVQSFIDTNLLRARQNPGNVWFQSNLHKLQRLEIYFLKQAGLS